MKKVISTLIFLFALSGMLLFDSCKSKSDDPGPATLTANAGADQTAAPFTTVTLDGSASTGEGTINYQWTYNGGVIPVGDLALLSGGGTEATATFIPPKNGPYNFTLRITQDSQFSEDQVTVTVDGVVSLSGTLAENLALKDIEPDPTKPDYRITSDLIIPAGKSIQFPSSGSIVIEVSDNAGIIIDGGSMTTAANGATLTLTSIAGWKGILLKSGSLAIHTFSKVEKGAKSIFAGQTEAAAITATGGNLTLQGISFTGSTGYDLLMPNYLTGSITIESNSFSAAKPIKTSIDMLPRIGFNNFTAPYDYVVLTTPGAGTTVSGNFIFRANAKYYIDGDFTAGSTITTSNTTTLDPTTIFMKAGAGILASGGVNFGDNVVFDGLNGAPWKGIAIGGNNGSSISGITIRNAGSAVFNTGSFTSDVKAAIYHFSNSSGVLSNSEIKDSQGYGLYNANPFSYLTLSNSTFINTALPAVSIQVDKVSSSISAGNTFTMTAGVAAVEVRAPNSSISPVGTWVALGGANYYLFTGSVFQSAGSWTLSPGVNLKFKAGKSLDIQAGLLTAIGTALSPITFDSQVGTAGTWAGIHIGSTSKLEFCQIKNGGDSFIFKFGVTQATEKANVVFNYGGGITTNTFKNNTITGSGGYGILVEATKQNPDAANGANSNTFSSNTSGNIIVK